MNIQEVKSNSFQNYRNGREIWFHEKFPRISIKRWSIFLQFSSPEYLADFCGAESMKSLSLQRLSGDFCVKIYQFWKTFCLQLKQEQILAQWPSCHFWNKAHREDLDAHHLLWMGMLSGADTSHCQKRLLLKKKIFQCHMCISEVFEDQLFIYNISE